MTCVPQFSHLHPSCLSPPPLHIVNTCRFPLELRTWTLQGLHQHQQQAHKHCKFCDMWFYAVDELWEHMRQAHFHCSLCRQTGKNADYYLQ